MHPRCGRDCCGGEGCVEVKSVQLMGQTILIKMVSEEEIQEHIKAGNVELKNNEDNLMGWFEPSTFTIFINKSLRVDVLRRTLLHEMTHALLEISGSSHMLSEKQEEAMCTLVENFHPLFKDEDFLKWF